MFAKLRSNLPLFGGIAAAGAVGTAGAISMYKSHNFTQRQSRARQAVSGMSNNDLMNQKTFSHLKDAGWQQQRALDWMKQNPSLWY